jgi:hypothetical protein
MLKNIVTAVNMKAEQHSSALFAVMPFNTLSRDLLAAQT